MSYRFNFEVAQDTITLMNNVNGNINTALAELERFCATQLAEWTGDAQTEYEAAKTEWNNAAKAMGSALTQGQTALVRISGGYGNAEGSARSVWVGR